MPIIVFFFVVLCGLLIPQVARCEPLERGVAITDPLALRALDDRELGLRRLMAPASSTAEPLSSAGLFALPSMASVRSALHDDFDRYVTTHKMASPSESIGIGPAFDFQLFDRAVLDSSHARFVLAGIVNRMDRAYVSPATCGEIRLIYRLVGIAVAESGEVPARLPMTLNVILNAKGESATITCSEIARSWLATFEWQLTGIELATRLTAKDGPLALIHAADIDRVETNLQIAHAPKSAVRDFRTDYLLKVFRYDAQLHRFEEAPMENQIDRDRILASADNGSDFRQWLLDPVHLAELDRGTVLIPERFLAASAVAATPAGFEQSELRPAFGLVHSGNDAARAVFSEGDVVAALKKAADSGVVLQNIRSPGGFERRLNDVTCAGCHQTRGIGGFHFPGVDWMAASPSNSTTVPASPHFFGDQPRRRDILIAMRDGEKPDYSRGFSDRPQLRASKELMGTEYLDGWGAHCYAKRANTADNDRSFQSWTCADGLACQAIGKSAPVSRMGMCFVGSR